MSLRFAQDGEEWRSNGAEHTQTTGHDTQPSPTATPLPRTLTLVIFQLTLRSVQPHIYQRMPTMI
jgi:hypothetical protein